MATETHSWARRAGQWYGKWLRGAETLQTDIRQCPFCAEDIKKAAIVCKHCGREVEPVS